MSAKKRRGEQRRISRKPSWRRSLEKCVVGPSFSLRCAILGCSSLERTKKLGNLPLVSSYEHFRPLSHTRLPRLRPTFTSNLQIFTSELQVAAFKYLPPAFNYLPSNIYLRPANITFKYIYLRPSNVYLQSSNVYPQSCKIAP